MDYRDLGKQPINVVDEVYYRHPHCGELGLTKREFFAGMALQGLCNGNADWQGWGINPATVAKMAAQAADALLVELSDENSNGA